MLFDWFMLLSNLLVTQDNDPALFPGEALHCEIVGAGTSPLCDLC